jgi:hypothetical protein
MQYDFTIYTQLTSVMSKVFFPASNPAVQALSIWGIFAGEIGISTGPPLKLLSLVVILRAL